MTMGSEIASAGFASLAMTGQCVNLGKVKNPVLSYGFRTLFGIQAFELHLTFGFWHLCFNAPSVIIEIDGKGYLES
jgi:hypothetical protein